jgi:hypothetical protein
MRYAGLARIGERPCGETLRGLASVARCAANHVDTVRLQHMDGSFTHVAGDHVGNPGTRKNASNVRLAPAALRRVDFLFRYDLLTIVERIDHEMLAVTEMCVHEPVSGGNRYLHCSPSFVFHYGFSSIDAEAFPVDNCVGYHASRGLHDSPEGLSGDSHLKSGCFLVKSFKIGEPNGLGLVEAERHMQ